MMLLSIGLAGLIVAGLVAGRQITGRLGRESRRLEAAPVRDGLADAAWSGMLDIRDARSRDLIDYWDEFARTGARPVAARHGRRRADNDESGSLALALMAALVPGDELPVGTPARLGWRLLADRAPSEERAGELTGVIERAKLGRRATASDTAVASLTHALATLLFGGRSGAGRRSQAAAGAGAGRVATTSGGSGAAVGRIPRQRGGQPVRVLHALRPPKITPMILKPSGSRAPGGPAGVPADGLLAGAEILDVDLTQVWEESAGPRLDLDLDAGLVSRAEAEEPAEVDDVDVTDRALADLLATPDVEVVPDEDDRLDLDLAAGLASETAHDEADDEAEHAEDHAEADDRAAEPADVLISNLREGSGIDLDADEGDLEPVVPEGERPTQQIQRVLPVTELTPSRARRARSVDLRDGHFTPRHH